MSFLTFEEIKRKKIRFEMPPTQTAHGCVLESPIDLKNKDPKKFYHLVLFINTYPSKMGRYFDIYYDASDLRNIVARKIVDYVLSEAESDETTDELIVQYSLRRLLGVLYINLDKKEDETPVINAICILLSEVLDHQREQRFITLRKIEDDGEIKISIEGLWSEQPQLIN